MDIFEQLQRAEFIIMNGSITTNFGWEQDAPEDDWMLSVYGDNFEYYISYSDMTSAVKYGSAWEFNDSLNFAIIEFAKINSLGVTP